MLYSVDSGRTDPILAAVGQLQFEVRTQFTLNVVAFTITVEDAFKTSYGQADESLTYETVGYSQLD